MCTSAKTLRPQAWVRGKSGSSETSAGLRPVLYFITALCRRTQSLVSIKYPYRQRWLKTLMWCCLTSWGCNAALRISVLWCRLQCVQIVVDIWLSIAAMLRLLVRQKFCFAILVVEKKWRTDRVTHQQCLWTHSKQHLDNNSQKNISIICWVLNSILF